MQKYRFIAFFEPQEEGGFAVTVPALPGCISEGDTFEEAQVNINEAIHSYLGSLVAENEALPRVTEEYKEVISPVNITFDPQRFREYQRTSTYA